MSQRIQSVFTPTVLVSLLSAASAESGVDATGLRDEVCARMAEIIKNQNLGIDTRNATAIAYNSEPRARSRIDALKP